MRPIVGREELDLFCRLPYVLDDELAGDLDSGRRRPEWMWIALRGDRLVARLAWWARRKDDPPFMLDTFDLDEAEGLDTGVRLLETAMAATLPSGAVPPEYSRFVPPGWRDDSTSRRAVEDRLAVLERAGARLLVERLRLEWRPGTPIPEPSGRLRFRPVGDREELVDLMTAVLDGTLDAHSRADLDRSPAAQVAAEQYDGELMDYKGPRNWWRIATTPGGEPVGFVIPTRNSYNPIIAYIGVLPAHRGNGYIDDLLAEGTRILAAQDVPRIRASTDVGNVPMAQAFERGGYVNFQGEINMTWS
ncbi:GNAT family N-acetyltransferase [Acrocarpospora sp. B8E8]|uniref:GNAT family N-acetyltransferase n=1 Tax=Acrocarpospora sp. B8E8 TaxID=3153572 RepID=UPI00325D1A33